MGWVIWAGLLPVCVGAGAWVVWRPARQVLDDLRFDRARDQFRLRREWLEARFLGALALVDPDEGARWEDARWHDAVVWARDRQTRRLLALIGVHFDSLPFDDDARHATALFEYRKGQWHADGRRLDRVRPDEALLRSPRIEPIVVPQRRA